MASCSKTAIGTAQNWKEPCSSCLGTSPSPPLRAWCLLPASKDKGYAARALRPALEFQRKPFLGTWSSAQGWPSSPGKECAVPRFQRKEKQSVSSSPPFPAVKLKPCHELAQPFTIRKPSRLSLALKPTSPAPFPSFGTLYVAQAEAP